MAGTVGMVVELTGIGDQVIGWAGTLIGEHGRTGLEILEIFGINILLSGDNAVVIALACRSLPAKTRMAGIVLGVLVAIGLRIVFTLGLQSILGWPWLTLAGGILLVGIAIQLVTEADHGNKVIADSKSLMGAVWTIAIADMVMSLDNVLAIAVAAHGKPWLVFFGLAMSIPIIVGGAALILALLTRFPILIWAGAALLGWIGGELIGREPMLKDVFGRWAIGAGLAPGQVGLAASVLGAGVVVVAGWIVNAWRGARRGQE